jgi:hypothetical protein
MWFALGFATHQGLLSRVICWSPRMILPGRLGRRRILQFEVKDYVQGDRKSETLAYCIFVAATSLGVFLVTLIPVRVAL